MKKAVRRLPGGFVQTSIRGDRMVHWIFALAGFFIGTLFGIFLSALMAAGDRGDQK